MTSRPGRPTRTELLANSVSHASALRADLAQRKFDGFREHLGLPEDAVALTLYLTWLRDEGLTSRQISTRLKDLELARRLRGQPIWRHLADVEEFLKGLYREDGLGPICERSEPLYREQVEALVNGIMSPTATQVRDRAAALLAHELGLTLADLCRLQWRHIRFGRDHIVVTPPPRPRNMRPLEISELRIDIRGGEACTVNAVRRWHELGGRPTDCVFIAGGHRCYPPGIARARRLLTETADPEHTVRLLTTSSIQDRDRLLVLLGYGAALLPIEAASLRQGQLALVPEGLLISIPGRDGATGIAADPGMPTDIVAAWQAWQARLVHHHLDRPDLPVFMPIEGNRLYPRPLHWKHLSRIVQSAVAKAGISPSHYSYTSLRWGKFRTALRSDEPLYSVAQHASMKPTSMLRHHRREHLIRRSVAGQLGL